MHKIQLYHLWKRRLFFVFVCSLGVIVMVSGCTPLKKKFTRKKKESDKTEKFIPVLEPIDYEEKVHTTQERYRHHYALWKVWSRDLLQVIERDGSDKRQVYLLAQVLEQINGMSLWIVEEKKEEFNDLMNRWKALSVYYEQAPVIRNVFSLKKTIEQLNKDVRGGFNPEIIFK